MKVTTEMKFVVSKGWVVNEEVMADGSRVFTIKPDISTTDNTTCHLREGIFKKVPVSELSLKDDFMNHIPKMEQEKKFMAEVKKVINSGMHDFWRPVCDPSFDDNGRICYEPGKMPTVGKRYNWWAKNAKEFCPERGSRLGTKSEYIAFLAVLIKELVAIGWKVADAWKVVCNDSRQLGHYWNSTDAKRNFETTGNRGVCGWCDLANAYKILAEDEEVGGFWLAGGCYVDDSNFFPLAGLFRYYGRYDFFNFSCGWLVLTEGSTDH